MECLFERGYGRLTTKVVETRAGVSRGALLHHYPSKSDLLVAAVEYMARRWERAMIEEAEDWKVAGIGGLLRALSRQFNAPLAYATMEIWVAARTDPVLRQALEDQERGLQNRLHEFVETFLGVDKLDADLQTGLKLCWQFLRGAAVSGILTHDEVEQNRLLMEFERLVSPYFATTQGAEALHSDLVG